MACWSYLAYLKRTGSVEKQGNRLEARHFRVVLLGALEDTISKIFEMIGDIVIYLRVTAHVVSQLLKSARHVHIICRSVADIRT